jgi:hypothetical protein
MVFVRATNDKNQPGNKMSEQDKATEFEAGKKYFAPGISTGEFDVIEVLKVTAKTVFFIDKYGEKRSKRIVMNSDCQTFEHIFGKFTPKQEATEEFEAARKIAIQIRRDKIAKEEAARKEKQRLTAYRIVKADGRIKFTGTERGSWFTLKDAVELVDRAAGEKVYFFDDYVGDGCEILPEEEPEVAVAEPEIDEIEGLDEVGDDMEPEEEVSLNRELKNDGSEASGLNPEELACEECAVKVGDVVVTYSKVIENKRIKTTSIIKHVFSNKLQLEEYFEQDCITERSACDAFRPFYDWELNFHCPLWHCIGGEKLWLSYDGENKVYILASSTQESEDIARPDYNGCNFEAEPAETGDDGKKYNLKVSYADGYSFLVRDCGHVISGSRKTMEALSKTCEWAGGTITVVEVNQ